MLHITWAMKNQVNTNSDNQSKKSFFDEKPIFVYDTDKLAIIDANSCAIDQYGYTRNELLKMKISDLGKRVHLTELKKKLRQEIDFHPNDVWNHQNKKGESWLIQFSTQKFRLEGKPVNMAVAHNIDHLVNKGKLGSNLLPKVDLLNEDMLFVWVEWNKALEVRNYSGNAGLIFGSEVDEVAGKSAEDLAVIGEEFLQEFKDKMNDAAAGGDSYFVIESNCVGNSGKELTCLWHNNAILDSDGKIKSIYSLVEDVSEQREFNIELEESESTFRIMSEQSFVGIYILKGRTFIYVNPRLCVITGYSEQELINDKSIWDLVHPDDLNSVRELYAEWEKNPTESVKFSLRIVSKNDIILHVKTFGSAIEKDGEQALLGVVIDQTNQIKALESYQSLFNSISDGVYIRDVEGSFLEVNKQFEKMYGYNKEEVLGKSISIVSATEKVDLNDANKRFNKVLKGKSQTYRWWGKRKNGELFPEEIKLSKGSFFGQDAVIAVAREITENVRREDELKRNEQLFEQLFRNSPLGIALLDKNYKITLVNKSFESMFGYKQHSIKGVDLDELIVPEDEIEEVRPLSHGQDVFTLTKKRKTSSGDLIDVFIYGVPVVLEGETIAMYAIYMDITDRIEVENRVKQSLKEKEVLLAEIHHRVKNNLAVITGLLELQYHNLKSAEAKNALRDSQMRINSMALIHEKLYQSETLSNIDFGVYIKELVQVIVKSHSVEGENVEIKMQSDPVQLPIKKAIPCGLIINEIVTNSMKYAFPKDQKNPTIHISLNRQDDRAIFQISDNGVGLEKPLEEMGKDSLGTLLIRTLAKQLEADLVVDGSDGTSYKFSFQLEN
ncbi:hypothetical protein BH23BAC3_BH23BAC3_04850 [soil metagenome]